MPDNIQIKSTISRELEEKIWELAIKESRTFSQMVAVLLKYGFEQKTRNRKVAKKNNSVQPDTDKSPAHNSGRSTFFQNSTGEIVPVRIKEVVKD